MSPRFADGLSAPRVSVMGHDLPLSRVVSRTMHPDEGYHDHAGTVMVIAWGQFMDHDYTLTGTPLDPLNRNDPEECCSRPPHLKNPYCNEILIPEDDYFYRLFNVRCMDFVRAFPAVRPGCRLGSRVPFNLLTGVLDGNTVYGITEVFARKLRTGYGGLLRMNPVFAEYGLKDLLPLKLDIPDEGCTRPNRSMYCFEAGEIRVNEQLVLTCMHTLMAREHNRLAKALALVNPHWDDEILFQEVRRIVIAEIQHITYNEFLPILLGKDVMEKFGVLLEKEKYWDGYDESINPGVIDAFAAAAFRFGHSLLPTAVERWSKAHKFIASKRLSDLIRRPYDLYRAGVFDEYFMGLMNQVAQAMDDSITQEVTNHLFKKVGAKFGMDLVSFNMQRGREFGIPSYMEFRKYCGLPGADSFEELFGSMPNETIRRYSTIFGHPADVDLWSGGVSERPLPGSMLGPTFACLIATQFSHSRRGDRFWYELPNQPSSFTLEQLNEIRKTKLARVICDNTDLIDTIQIYPMVLPDHDINPRVPCRTQILPSIDLSKWAEYPTSHAAQYDIVTKKSAEAASEMKPVMQPAYLSKFMGKSKLSSAGTRNSVNDVEKKPSEPWRAHHAQEFAGREAPRPSQGSPGRGVTLPRLSLGPSREQGEKPAVEVTAMKITTIIETMRRRLRRSVPRTEGIGTAKKRSRRSLVKKSREATKAPGRPRSGQAGPSPTAARDAVAASNGAIPSTVFYKRIWEYINGTRPHSDIIKYSSEENSKADRSICVDKDPSTSRSGEGPQVEATVKPERELYKRIWDIINATSTRGINMTDRSKRDAGSSPAAAPDRLCLGREKGDKRARRTNGEARLGRADATQDTRETSLPDPHISGSWAVASKEVPVEAIEAADLNRSLNEPAQDDDPPAEDNSPAKSLAGEEAQDLRKPGPPYSRENPGGSSLSPSAHAIDKASRNDDRAEYAERDEPLYDPAKIPYVEVPDYSDQRQDTLDKSNRSAVEYKDYDDGGDYVEPESSYRVGDSSSRSPPSTEVPPLPGSQAGNDGGSSHVNAASRCTAENQDSAECAADKSDAAARNRSQDDANDDANDDARGPPEDSSDDFAPIHFDIEEYRKPFDLDQFLKSDFVSEPGRGAANEAETKQQDTKKKKAEDSTKEPEEKYRDDEYRGEHVTYPEEKWYDYFTKNTDFDDGDFGEAAYHEDEGERGNPDAERKAKGSETVLTDYDPYDDRDFLKRIFEKDDKRKAQSEVDKTEDEFLSRYFTQDVLRQLRENSMEAEDRKREESRSRENVHRTLSEILNNKNRFSRLDENLDKMIEKGEAVPIRYNNFWSLEYESPRRKDKSGEEEREEVEDGQGQREVEGEIKEKKEEV
ncbi:Chorion peroxidase [Harpegnathos saltator]|uniref:Chorion peroxidase n=1 Tax=Harpegnathos saltator TaxID=610380 RepID=E2BSX7_HARSA|nr:Chorion peroxidase [Harpegnathos saltator]